MADWGNADGKWKLRSKYEDFMQHEVAAPPAPPVAPPATPQEAVQWKLSPNRRAFLDTISFAEGTDLYPDEGYQTQYGGGQFEGAVHPQEVVEKSGRHSSAAGRYQFLGPTWNEVQSKHGLEDFSPRNQDTAALVRLKARGALSHVDVGQFREAAKRASKEWAGFPGGGYGQSRKSLEELEKHFQGRLKGYTIGE